MRSSAHVQTQCTHTQLLRWRASASIGNVHAGMHYLQQPL